MEKDRKKKIIALLLIAVISTLSVAFAAMSRTLSINGTAKMDTALWDVHFENLSDARIIRDAIEINKPYISDDGIMIYNMDIKLTNPKDEIIYTVEIVNSGSIDAEIESIEVPVLTEEQEKLIDFTAVYNDGTSITEKDFLKAGKKDLITISIKYSDDITAADLPEESLTINFTFKINYIQSDSLVNENSGKAEVVSVLAKGNSGAATSTFYNGSIAKNTVESIDFLSTMYVPNDAIGSWDASQYKNGSVVAWYQDIDKNGLYELYIGGNGKVYAPTDSSWLFGSFSKLSKINFNNNFDTSNVTDMLGLFRDSVSITNIDFTGFNTSNVTTMKWLLMNCNKLEQVNVSSLDTSNVTDMTSVFSGCSSLKNLDVSNFNTEKAITMESMFNNCTSLMSLDLSSFNTKNVTNMTNMFRSIKLDSINLSLFNTSNVTSMGGMFYGVKINTLDLSGFNTGKVNSFSEMFRNARIENLNMTGWDTSKVTNMWYMFMNSNIPILDLSSFNTSNVKNMACLFSQTFSTTEIKFNKLDTTSVTDYWQIFGACNVKTLDISEVEPSMYSNDAFKGILSNLKASVTVYVLNEECVTLGQAIRNDVNFVVKEA